MRVFVGTSGFSYPAWRGSFYPLDLPPAERLRCYAQKLPAVEINNTFYRMPSPELLARWAAETPDGFRFVLKAPRRITHTQRLGEGEGLDHFLEVAGALGVKLGPVLFQTPPFFKQDLARLQAFLGRLPAGTAAAFEFRHPSWFEEPVFEALRAHAAALVWADSEKTPVGESAVATASWGYLRLRRQDYDAEAVAAWADRIRAQAWSDAWVFFKHEDAGTGPALATRLLELV
jgi:uncharacterized protein YecE (DUF72 family)